MNKSDLLQCFDDTHSEFVALGKRIGADALDVVLEIFGGQKPHVPSTASFWDGLQREVRDEQIRTRFRGNNIDELAAEYGLGPRHIRDIVLGSRGHRPKMARIGRQEPGQESSSERNGKLARKA